jgi:hypothetical protein
MLAVRLRALHVATSAGQSNVVYAPGAGLYSQLGGLLVILHAEGSIWRTNGAARRSGCRESGHRGDPSGVPLTRIRQDRGRSGAHER